MPWSLEATKFSVVLQMPHATGLNSIHTFSIRGVDQFRVYYDSSLGQPARSHSVRQNGQLYGIDRAGTLYKVDKTSGSLTAVGATSITAKADGAFINYIHSSAVIDPQTGKMYWAYCPKAATLRFMKLILKTRKQQNYAISRQAQKSTDSASWNPKPIPKHLRPQQTFQSILPVHLCLALSNSRLGKNICRRQHGRRPIIQSACKRC